jgi:hypothetical protein
MVSLQPCEIASFYTAQEILDEIDKIKSAISAARESISDRFGDTQADQQVRRQKLETLNSELSVYIKAYNIKSGNGDCATIKLTSANYTPTEPRI